MSENAFDEQERSLDLFYKNVCEFEKPKYEKLNVNEDGSIVLTIDKGIFMQLENPEGLTNEMLEPIEYSSYGSLFNNRYKNNFKRNLTALKISSLENELGKETIEKISQRDDVLKKIYGELNKERDLDNDGVPDRIDIDDTRNNVQTVKDLDSVKNSTSASTQRYREKRERQRNEQRRKEELEL